jgi:surfeit locus 1 family protein
VLPGLATLVCVAILVALGVWQLQRLAWKEALVAQVAARLSAPPIPAPGPAEWPRLDLAALGYQPVTVSGEFFADKEAYVVHTLTAPKGRYGGVGYLVMTPLLTQGGWTVYVNRGFVPADRRYPSQRPEGVVEGSTTVTGLLRVPSRRQWFMPGDAVPDKAWFSRDPQLYAAAYGAPSAEVAPYIIDAIFDSSLPGGLPQGGETIVEFPNNHLGYAITWFGLAIAALAIFAAFAAKRLRGPQSEGHST